MSFPELGELILKMSKKINDFFCTIALIDMHLDINDLKNFICFNLCLGNGMLQVINEFFVLT